MLAWWSPPPPNLLCVFLLTVPEPRPFQVHFSFASQLSTRFCWERMLKEPQGEMGDRKTAPSLSLCCCCHAPPRQGLLTPAAEEGSYTQIRFPHSTSKSLASALLSDTSTSQPVPLPRVRAPGYSSEPSSARTSLPLLTFICLDPSSAGPFSQLWDSKIQFLPFVFLDLGIVAASCSHDPCVTLVFPLFSVLQFLFN